MTKWESVVYNHLYAHYKMKLINDNILKDADIVEDKI